ncbi:Hypothetical predicted protein [Paramuricea clavata]|uniref:Uncharacterized protein n=1 Tax=Paramuricea clavata TaxID=317549 RepID=A0A6S7L506_PARCT|nr:Hypothetical predicted protein [Paramuricea clavata]
MYTPSEDTCAVEYFNRFFAPVEEDGQSLWTLLVQETNKYEKYYVRKNPVLSPKSKVRKWEDVDVNKMKAFIGIILNMGLIKKHSIESYWNCKDYSQDTPMFRKVFKLDTFKLLLHFFRVSDSDLEPSKGDANYDLTYKFRNVLQHFNSTWAREFELGQNISIDESIVGFKGRHHLVNYIKIKKHHQWGPKEYNLCDAETGYCHQTVYHTKGLKVSQYGQPFDVCDKLLTGHGNKNHHLVVNNYYTSIALCEEMLKKGIYVTGTV